jgi:hypothetical protein
MLAQKFGRAVQRAVRTARQQKTATATIEISMSLSASVKSACGNHTQNVVPFPSTDRTDIAPKCFLRK